MNFYIPGKEYMHMKNEKILQYYENSTFQTETKWFHQLAELKLGGVLFHQRPRDDIRNASNASDGSNEAQPQGHDWHDTRLPMMASSVSEPAGWQSISLRGPVTLSPRDVRDSPR